MSAFRAHPCLYWLSLFLAVTPGILAAQTPEPCSDPEYAQLDFWVGDWEVTGPDGEVVGDSTVRPILGGCAIREEWSGQGSDGIGFFAYDRPSGVWRQMWVDANGAVLWNAGQWDGSGMVLRGERRGSDGVVRHLRVTLRAAEQSGVRQLIERSEDGGTTWTVIFDGRYRPVDS